MEPQTLFNWLAKKSEFQPTLGYLAMRPVLGKLNGERTIYNVFNLNNAGRIKERAVFATGAALTISLLHIAGPAAPVVAIVGLTYSKAFALVAGKMSSVFSNQMAHRVLPKMHKMKQAKQKPQA
jgi:hypothetical protein